jgi:hypothetical protein
MVRREMITPDFRLPPEDENGFTPGHPLQMRMVAAGAAIRVPKTLYLRWIRKGGVTDRWKELSYEEMLRGRQKDLAQTFVVIDQLVAEPENRQVLKFALALYALRKLVRMCRNEGRAMPRMTDLHPDAPNLELPKNIERFGPVTRRMGAALAKLTPEAKQVA